MPVSPPLPPPRPPSPPDGIAMSKELREWLGHAVVDWDADFVKAVDGLRTSYNTSVNSFLDGILFGQPLLGTVDGTNVLFVLPQRIRTLPTGEGQGLLWVGSTLYSPTSATPGPTQWRINIVTGNATYPNGQQIEVGVAPLVGTALIFGLVCVVQ